MPLLKQIIEFQRARAAGASLGDLAALKFDMLEGPAKVQNHRLRALGLADLDVDLDALRRLPAGTVGREYARMLDARGLAPLVVGPAVRERLAERPLALRYTTTHDLFHVLTGFSTHPAGELGLFAFMIAQGFAGGSRRRLWVSAAIYAAMLPLHARDLLHNLEVGLAMGARAENLLEQPLAEYLDQPLDGVRRRLGLPDPAAAGITPGRPSWLLDRLVEATLKAA